MNLFIDTNIFLSFYHFTSDDLEELNKLTVLLRQSKMQLYLPEQIIDEFRRNRESKIADALKRLKEQRLNLQFPQLCKDYGVYSKLRDLQKAYEQGHSELLKILTQDIVDEKLKADLIINDLFALALTPIKTLQIFERAKARYEIGNPPGKKGSLGDAINWETLLEIATSGQPIHFITDDSDYCSALDENRFDSFLLAEWKRNKNSDIFFYSKLSDFFKSQFPEIRLASEYERDSLISDLASSDSFEQTHKIVSRLRQYTEFTQSQLNSIILASISNNQIYWILTDVDVKEFLINVIRGKERRIELSNIKRLKELFAVLGDDSREIIDSTKLNIPF